MSFESNLLEEYRALRSEIERTFVTTVTVFLANMSVGAVLIGYGLSLEKRVGVIFLTPFIVIVPGLFFLASQGLSVTRIATYIMEFIEPFCEGLNWETRLFKVRQERLLPRQRIYQKSLSAFYGLLGVICIYLSWLYWEPASRILWGLVAASLGIACLLAVVAFNCASSHELFRRYREMWRKLRNAKK